MNYFFPLSLNLPDDTIYYEDISASSDSDDHLITNNDNLNLNISIEQQQTNNVERSNERCLANFNEQSQTVASMNESNLFTAELRNAHQRMTNQNYQSFQTFYQGPPTETSTIAATVPAAHDDVDNEKSTTKV